tara:strand:+ start:91844 stop:92065 length:222 start_codon:yes stop_codon:yes gene_type:complete
MEGKVNIMLTAVGITVSLVSGYIFYLIFTATGTEGGAYYAFGAALFVSYFMISLPLKDLEKRFSEPSEQSDVE